MNKISSLRQTQQDRGVSVSGQGMDRRIEKKTPLLRKLGYAVAGILALVFAWWLVTTLLAGRSLSVDSQRISVAEVTVGTFEDFIPLRGRLVPRSTVYLDAVEGGRVERVLVEDGTIVEAGDPIVLLSNTNLQLEVLGREAAVTEQLNFMRTLELQLEQNRLSHKRNLVEIDYQITRLTRSIERQTELAEKDLVSRSTLDELQDELDYYRRRRDVTVESQATDARLQEEQLRQLRASGDQLETSLAIARKNIDDLNVRAPVAGKLSGFNVEIGQSIERGGRIGQIDDPDAYKLNARIDEFYLGRVDLGQTAIATHNDRDLDLTIAKIYPQVREGQFEVDMLFAEEPVGLRRGQTLQLRLTRSIKRQTELAQKDLVSRSTLDELQDELDYYRKRRDVTVESQATDARLQEEQLRQLRASGAQLETSLAIARKNIDDLNVRAPVAGKLSGFNVEIGQSIERGGRIGQIDDPDAYKLNARIDEFYLGRVDLGQTAIATHNGRDLDLTIAKIYPQVRDGQFEVDMLFAEEPVGLRRGQTLQLRLTLGDNADAVLIPNGSFYQETGGNWIFVVSPDGTEAVRRSVRLGRRNTEFIEVLDGLEPGERVITSPYTSYSDMDRLVLGSD